MDINVANLQYRVASLEAHLAVERQRVEIAERTVLYLSTLLSKLAQVDSSNVHKDASRNADPGEENPESERLTVLNDFPSLQPTVRARASEKYCPRTVGCVKTQNHKVTKSSHVPDAEVKPIIDLFELPLHSHTEEWTMPLNVSPANSKSTGLVDTSSSMITTVGLSDDEEVKMPIVNVDEKPPSLDLQFKGLITSHDGPVKVSTKSSFDSYWSSDAPSFEKVFGMESAKVRDEVARTLKVDDKEDDWSRVAAGNDKIGGAMEDLSKNINDNVLSFSRSKSYRSRITAEQSFSSNSSQNIDNRRNPLSVSHGIHYKPKEKDPFLNRSRVMIFNLPSEASAADILGQIRGGTVISCQILDTTFAYKSFSAMVRFSSSIEAMRCVENAANTPVAINGRIASVQLIPTPSYPLPPEVYKNIFEHGHTRCLRIYHFKRRVPAHIRRHYMDPKYIEVQMSNGCGDWCVRFTSVQRASALWRVLKSLHSLKSADDGFMADPCYEEESPESQTWMAGDTNIIDIGTLRWED